MGAGQRARDGWGGYEDSESSDLVKRLMASSARINGMFSSAASPNAI